MVQVTDRIQPVRQLCTTYLLTYLISYSKDSSTLDTSSDLEDDVCRKLDGGISDDVNPLYLRPIIHTKQNTINYEETEGFYLSSKHLLSTTSHTKT